MRRSQKDWGGASATEFSQDVSSPAHANLGFRLRSRLLMMVWNEMTLLSKAQTCPLDVQRIIMSCLTPRDAACMALTCRNWLYASRERLYRVILRDGCYGTLKRLDRTLNGSAEIRNFVKFLSIFDCEYHWVLPDWMTLLPAGNVRQVKLLLQNSDLCVPPVSPVLSLPLMNQVHTLFLKFGLWKGGVREFMALPNLRRLWLEPRHVSQGQQLLLLHPVSLPDCRLTINDPWAYQPSSLDCSHCQRYRAPGSFPPL
ncbi:uncharacterized protein EI90DRAFT_2179267 [Cantharellus anzutake]|uniref:uncharacterized protein n=1 Tax=Cantharellus anzutake TaxID=1750568 RepID=UPI0019083444|nr:uncharacterized protein EI90DRAFT_2179267 [Cantharellus anzutake]KAF8325213.1 hypothetical protein EI90DRAFT_2179267 [Cantharellus anzutake]